MTYRVGPKGQVVLPKRIRDRLGIRPGDEVEVSAEGQEVRIRPSPPAPERVRGVLRVDPPDRLTATLEADHRWELAHDELRHAERELGDRRRR